MQDQKEEFARLETIYRRRLKKNPDDAEALHMLGVCAFQRNDLIDAYQFMQKAILLAPDNPEYHNNFGNLYKQLGKSEKAILHYQKAIELNPYYAISYNNIGSIYLKQNNLVKAQEYFEKAINLLPDLSDAHYNLASVLTKKGLLDSSIEQLDLILALYPKHSLAHHKKAQISYQQGKLISAIHHYQEFLKLEPYDINALHNLGSIFLKLHAPEKATRCFLRLVSLSADSENYYNLGTAYMEQEKHQEAAAYFKQALQSNPNYVDAHVNLGAIYLKLEDYPNAIKHYQEIMRQQPNNAEIAYILSAISNNGQNYKAAPHTYIQNLFDQYALHYEKHLTKILDSKIPELIYNAVIEVADNLKARHCYCKEVTIKQSRDLLDQKIDQIQEFPESPPIFDARDDETISQQRYDLKIKKYSWNILDLGCGTGLAGEKFRPLANKLIGIDLSEKMLAYAQQKKIYDELLLADIAEVIEKHRDLDLVIAADTLVYIGDLDQIFTQLALALKPDGLFVFTIEKTGNYPYALQNTARFAHHEKYLQDLSMKCHFGIILKQNIVLRKHRNGVIEGFLYVLRCNYCEF